MTYEHAFMALLSVFTTIALGLSAWALTTIFKIHNKQTQSDSTNAEKFRGIEKTFSDRKDDRIREQTLMELRINSVKDSCEMQKNFLTQQLAEIKVGLDTLHRRVDEVLSQKAKI